MKIDNNSILQEHPLCIIAESSTSHNDYTNHVFEYIKTVKQD